MFKTVCAFFIFSFFVSGFARSHCDYYYQPLPRSDKIHRPSTESPPMVESYNSPARIDTRGDWDFFFKTSFIWWKPREEGLELGRSLGQNKSRIVNMNFTHQPGFKIGLGFFSDKDDWEFYSEYTWLHMSHSKTKTAPAGEVILTRWLANEEHASSVKGVWHLKLNLLNFELARPYFSGKLYMVRPFIGMRLAFITQRFNYDATSTDLFQCRARSRNWGIGPRVGTDTNWALIWGIHIFGDISTSLLYTHYNAKVRKNPPNIPVKDVISYLRSNAEYSTGIGWGSYFSNYRFHIDVFISYEAKIFWNQNMMRHLSDNIEVGIDGDYGDLYTQGLTAGLRFDF